VEKAIEILFDEYEIICEVICPSRLYPLNISPVLDSINKTGKIIFIEEGTSFAALSSEVIAQLNELGAKLDKVKRISWNGYIPASYELEKIILPDTTSIIKGVLECLR
jgi:2-oxoisovalerate dehydrogenase E1 component